MFSNQQIASTTWCLRDEYYHFVKFSYSFNRWSPLKGHGIRFIMLAQVVQTLDCAIHRIKIYPVDSIIGFPNTCPLDGDLSSG